MRVRVRVRVSYPNPNPNPNPNQLLTNGITDEVVGAMRMLVDYILKGGAPSGDGREVSTDET